MRKVFRIKSSYLNCQTTDVTYVQIGYSQINNGWGEGHANLRVNWFS